MRLLFSSLILLLSCYLYPCNFVSSSSSQNSSCRRVQNTQRELYIEKIESLLQQVNDATEISEKTELVTKIEGLVYSLHELINESIRADFGSLQERIGTGEATIQDVSNFFSRISILPALKEIKGGFASKLEDGTFMDLATHCQEVIRCLQMLEEGNYDYLNQRMLSGESDLDRTNFDKVAAIYSSLMENAADKEVIWIAAALHDYGKVLFADHYTDGVKLAGDLLEELGVEEEKRADILDLIFLHGVLGEITLGEKSPKNIISYLEEKGVNDKNKFLKMLLVLNVVDTAALGSGWTANRQLEEKLYLADLENLVQLAEIYHNVRISGLLGGPVAVRNAKGELNQDEIASHIPSVINEIYQNEITEQEKVDFFDTFMREMKFNYTTFLLRGMNPQNVIKWLYLNAQVVRLSDNGINSIINTSDRRGEEVDVIFDNISIEQIRNTVEQEEVFLSQKLQNGEMFELFGIQMRFERENGILIIDTNNLPVSRGMSFLRKENPEYVLV
ncbi:MAG: HD domain-containing protein [Candidatus Kaelpia aquatica]|nr:HD domain-containing protein [Candidatus Kaelpia aquatica]